MGKKKRKGGPSRTGGVNETPKYTAEDLLAKVEEYINTFDYDVALKFCEKAMELDPGNAKVIETSACVYAEAGDMELSKKYFLKAAEMNPDSGHEKYMYLGQMSEGDEAKKWYLKGIEIMENEIVDQGGIGEDTIHKLTKTDISNAFCALAEIYMTDCCFEEDAASQCEKYCSKALEYDQRNYEAYIVNANYFLNLEMKEEAKDLLKQCFELLNIKQVESENEEMEESPVNGETTEAESNLDEENSSEELPPYASRVTLAKLLLETGEHDKAEVILNTLFDDTDEDIEVWYMCGWNCYLQDEFSDAVFYLEKAKEIYEKLACDEKELLDHVHEMLEKCKNQTVATSNGMEVEE